MPYCIKPTLLVYILRYRKPSPQTFILHHGVKGQKWGVRRGPPYSLSDERKETVEKTSKPGIIKVTVSGHAGSPKRSTPNSILDHVGSDRKIDSRSFYGETGLKVKDIHATDHGYPKQHPIWAMRFCRKNSQRTPCPSGVIVTHPREVAVLRRIFNEYLKGLSLLKIANQLNDENVECQPGVTGWNKSRIMRLIEDEWYTGRDDFPAIIDKEMHYALCQIKTERNTQAGTDRNHEIFHIDVPVVCPVCGSEMSRRHDSRFKKCQQRWICSNADCHTVIHKADDELLNDITVLLNRLIVNPGLVLIPAEIKSGSSVQVLKTENEIARTLDTLDYDEDILRQNMLECVSLKYADIDSALYTAHRLKATLADVEPLSAFSLPLFKTAVKEIHLEKDGDVAITADALKHVRMLKEIGVDIFFEEQNIHSTQPGAEFYITIYGSIAQSESENISANFIWGKNQSARGQGSIPI